MYQKQERYKQKENEQTQEQKKVQEDKNDFCPNCGASITDRSATFCEECGEMLGGDVCKKCGAPLIAGADVCESCGTFVLQGMCSFCGEAMNADATFCEECGAPSGGITCPYCKTISHTAFCSHCNMPLTDLARLEKQKAMQEPAYMRVMELSKEINELESMLSEMTEIEEDSEEEEEIQRPKTEKEILREKRNAELENLYQNLVSGDVQKEVIFSSDNNTPAPSQSPVVDKREEEKRKKMERRKAREEQQKLIKQKRQELQKVLNDMKPEEELSPQEMRNYFAARIPEVSSAVWLCRFNESYHPNPSHCGKPFMGGEWVVVNEEIEWETHYGNM